MCPDRHKPYAAPAAIPYAPSLRLASILARSLLGDYAIVYLVKRLSAGAVAKSCRRLFMGCFGRECAAAFPFWKI